jgi:hypothetical protein
MTKMEALLEVNNMITEVLDDIETEMFLENIIIDDNETHKTQNTLFENKMVR